MLTISIGSEVPLLCRWIGSNTLPRNDAGQGNQPIDRNNLLLLTNQVNLSDSVSATPLFDILENQSKLESFSVSEFYWLASRQQTGMGQSIDFLEFTSQRSSTSGSVRSKSVNMATTSSFSNSSSYVLDLDTDPLLYNASAYFDLGIRLISADSSGVYHYVSTRNNDFSNRDQKGRVIVQPFDFKYIVLGADSYSVTLG